MSKEYVEISQLTVGSLFSGIGGFDLGFERAGMKVIWQCEIDKYCQRVLHKHWPDVTIYDDIRLIDESTPCADVIVGGFPCQPFSVAGKRRGTEDNRYLWPEMLRVISTIRPNWVVGKNVHGIISMELDNVLSDLEGEGYETVTFNIPACAVDAPHRRERVWIVAHSNGSGSWSESRNTGDERWFTGDDRGEGLQKHSRREKSPSECDVKPASVDGGENVANAKGGEDRRIFKSELQSNFGTGSKEDVADSDYKGPQRHGDNGECPGELPFRTGRPKTRGQPAIWQPEPKLGRVATRISNRVDRLRSLGNAVVPQVAEQLGKMIIACEESI